LGWLRIDPETALPTKAHRAGICGGSCDTPNNRRILHTNIIIDPGGTYFIEHSNHKNVFHIRSTGLQCRIRSSDDILCSRGRRSLWNWWSGRAVIQLWQHVFDHYTRSTAFRWWSVWSSSSEHSEASLRQQFRRKHPINSGASNWWLVWCCCCCQQAISER